MDEKKNYTPWIISGLIGGILVYIYLKYRDHTLTLQLSPSQPTINIDLSGLEQRFETFEYKLNQLQLQLQTPHGTYLMATPTITKPLIEANIEKKEVKMVDEINNKVFDETFVSTETTYVSHNISDFLSHNAENITIKNDGAGEIYIQYSPNGKYFSNEAILYETESKIYTNVSQLKVRTPSTGVKYRISNFEIKK